MQDKSATTLSPAQLKAASEMTGNIAVAWFAAGVISPIIAPPRLIDLLSRGRISLTTAITFAAISIYLVRDVKS
jgi:hypothetical protein